MANRFYIETIDGRASFYNKCYVEENDQGEKVLTSYTTQVMKITAEGVPVRLWAGYSQTTQRHINAFLDFYGLSQYIGKANTQKLDLVEA